MTIEKGTPEPLYVQIADRMRERVRSGEYLPNRAVPSIVDLAGEFGVAQMTVRRALGVLKEEGFLFTVRKRGTYVSADRDGAERLPEP